MQLTVTTIFVFILMLVISPMQFSDAAPGTMSKRQAYQLLKAGDSSAVRSLAAGDREIMLAKLALDAGKTNEAIRILSSASMAKNPLAAAIRAEAYRQQSVAAARRAGHYAHAVSGDIGRLQKARFNIGLDQAEKRLQVFMVSHAASQPVSTELATVASPPVSTGLATVASQPVSTELATVATVASTRPSQADLTDSIRRAISVWRKDWESRHADVYLSHYHPDFRTKKHDFASWSTYKRRINSRKKFIRVKLSDLKVIRGPEKIPQGEAMLVAFKQRYESSNYAANSRKQLYLVRRNADSKWLILYEGEASPPYHRSRAKAASQIALRNTDVLKTASTDAWAINLGSFDSAANAEQMASGIQRTGTQQPSVSSVSVGGKAVHRVRVGLYPSRSEAVDAMVKICPELGLTDCWLEQIKKRN